jgi:ankyrin repeat protein
LHWAASSGDVAVLDALLDAGADIEADGAVIGGGTALADATAFGQWNAARRLVERAATTTLGEAASLGLLDRVRTHLADDHPTSQDLTSALWMACHGGQQDTAELLLDHGADLNWVGYDHLTPLDAAARSDAAELVDWLRRRGALSATAGGGGVHPGAGA